MTPPSSGPGAPAAPFEEREAGSCARRPTVGAVHHGEFRDPRLVEVYDAECPWSRDDDFFVAVVGDTPVRVVDLGCGSGRLALGLAAVGHEVTGIDPAHASLDAARRKPGASLVRWVVGTSSDLPSARFDVAVLTSHVVQLLVDEDEWRRSLADLWRSLVPGATLAFDSRDPDARAWAHWNPVDSKRTVVLGDRRVVHAETEMTAIEGDVVDFEHRYAFPDGEVLRSTATMRFRSEAVLRSAVSEAGFAIESVVGGWRGEPVGAGDGELLVVARR